MTEACDHCGRPVRIRLDRDVHPCIGCGAQVAFRPEVAQRIAAARAALFRMDVRQRQLSGRQTGAAQGSSSYSVLLLVVILLACLPFGGCSAFSMLSDDVHPDDRVFIVLAFTAPLVVMGALAAMVVYAFRRARRKLLAACTAVPPAAPGEPAGCHVCGAPLVAAPNGAIARCSFCGADNVVAAQAMTQAQHAHAHGAMEIEATLRREAVALGTVSGLLVTATIACTFIVPIVIAIAECAILFSCRSWEHPPDGSVSYALVDMPEGRCLTRVREHDRTVSAGPNGGWKPVGSAKVFRAPEIVGKRARPRTGSSKTFAAVTKVTSSPFYGNLATIQHPDAANVGNRVELTSLCLEP